MPKNIELTLTRRRLLQFGGAGWLALQTGHPLLAADETPSRGAVVGHSEGAMVGLRVLSEGGNAVDAAVAAALVAGVVAVPMCGIGGYGGHMVIAWPFGRVTAIDFNSAAPASARDDMFPLDGNGHVRGAINQYGWLAAGVPGTLAGLQLALDRFGTRSLSNVIEPAIGYARDGFKVSAALTKAIRSAVGQFERDAGSRRLFYPEGKPLAEGETFRNPDLASLLERLANNNSVADFYRGQIAQRIAAAFQRDGGVVTEQDLANYEANEVAPLSLEWRGHTIHTAPLTAGGLSVLQTLSTLKALHWESSDSDDPKATHARVEALRLAWQDRLTLLGDPQGVDVPRERLLSGEYADRSADRVRAAVAEQKMIPPATDGRTAGGTIHLTAADATGMMVAVTLTHGEGFGARVTVDGLGLILGHGMSRFDPRPGRANSPRGGRRPLNNMCPTVVTRDGRPTVALGATGGRHIPNTLVDVLSHLVGRGQTLAAAAAVPRLHTEGDATLQLANGWNEAHRDYLARAGYTIQGGNGANLNGIARDLASGSLSHVP